MLGAARVKKTSSSLGVEETDSDAGKSDYRLLERAVTRGGARGGRWQLSLEESALEEETPGTSSRMQSPAYLGFPSAIQDLAKRNCSPNIN